MLRAFVLTLVVVPLAVYLVVPLLMSIFDRYLASSVGVTKVCLRSGVTTRPWPQIERTDPDADDRRLRRRGDVR